MVVRSSDPARASRAPLFIVHAGDDAWFVHGQLLPALGLDSDEVVLSSEMPLGELTLNALERFVTESRATLVLVSRAAAAEAWSAHAALLASHAAAEGEARVVPLVLDDSAGALWLRAHVSIDLRQEERWTAELSGLARRLGELGEPAGAREEALACPYPGMRSLGESDAALLFGRERELDDIMTSLSAGQRQLLLVGPSGSGKSSLVHAGVLPRLTGAAWRDRLVCQLRPGQRPMQRLQEALALPEAPADPAGDLAAIDWGARAAQLLAGRGEQARLVLVIDQLEEVFALAEDAERRAFFAAALALREQARCHLILSLRADFFGELIGCPLWSGEEEDYRVVTPLRGEALRGAIVLPAQAAGVYLQPALVERLLVEASASPHSLPLLQAALVQLWELRSRRSITLDTYQRLSGGSDSGLGAAMSRHASASLDQLSPAQRKIARRVLLRLVSFGECAQDSRWPRPRAALSLPGESPAALEAVLEHLTRARLIVRDVRDAAGSEREQIVDLAHEALLSSWTRLASWIGERRSDGHRRRHLEHAAALWVARGRGEGGLLSAIELSAAEAWRKSERARELGVSAELAELFAASAHAVRRRGRRTGLAAASFTTVAVIAAALLILFLLRGREIEGARLQIHEVDRDRGAAVKHSRAQRAHRQEERAREELRDGKPQRALPYLLAARESRAGVVSDALALMFQEATRAVHVAALSHRGEVRAIALSPDGALAATGSADGSALIWHTRDGAVATLPLRHDGGAVTSVAFFPDGQRLASAGDDGTVRIWSVSGERLQILRHGAGVRVLRVSPDGETVVSGGDDQLARLWNARTGAALASLPHGAAVTLAAFGRDGATLVTGSADRRARLWRVRDGVALTAPLPHQDALASVELSPDGRRLLTATVEEGAKIWDATTGKALITIAVPKGLSGAAFRPDGSQLVTAGDSRSVRRWDAARGVAIGASMSHDSGVNAASYSADGRWIATASQDKTARVWNADTGSEVAPALLHDVPVRLVAISGDGSVVVTSGAEPRARLWHVTLPVEEQRHFAHAGSVLSASFDRGGGWLVTGGADRMVRWWDAVTGALLGELARKQQVEAAAVHPRRTMIAVAAAKSVALVDPRTGQTLRSLEHSDIVEGLAFAPDGETLISASRDGEVWVWSTGRGGAPLARWSAGSRITSVAVAGDASRVALGLESGGARLWEVRTQRAVDFDHGGRVTSVELSADGQRLFTAGDNGLVSVWDAARGVVLFKLSHKRDVHVVRASPDGKWIATVSRKRVIVWEAASGEEVVHRDFDERLHTIAWSPDSAWLAIGGKQDRVDRWSISLDRRSLEEWRAIAVAGPLELEPYGSGPLREATARALPLRRIETSPTSPLVAEQPPRMEASSGPRTAPLGLLAAPAAPATPASACDAPAAAKGAE